jgi:hypothetical protein
MNSEKIMPLRAVFNLMSIMKLFVSVNYEVEAHLSLYCTACSETSMKQLVLCSRF